MQVGSIVLKGGDYENHTEQNFNSYFFIAGISFASVCKAEEYTYTNYSSGMGECRGLGHHNNGVV